jgi:hypothetical protein
MMRPDSSPAMGSRFIASRRRCIKNHADLAVRPYLRSTSRALIPFLAEHASKITSSQIRSGIFEPWKIVPTSTVNCLRQSAHFHTRRSLVDPVRVLRLAPLAGVRK